MTTLSEPTEAARGAPAGEPAVTVQAVTRTFPGPGRGEAVTALSELSLRVAPGEVVAVVGPSGCGKSTLLELVCRLQHPDAGAIQAQPAVYMPQRDALLPWLSALDNAALPLRVAGLGAAAARDRTRPAFAEFGLDGFERARPAELSGGMRQRVALLRTFQSGKPVLALDEPFASLDAITRAQLQAWLGEALEREPRSVLLVTHDVEEAVVLADRVLVLSPRPGRVVADFPVELPGPRSRTAAAVVALRERALEALAS